MVSKRLACALLVVLACSGFRSLDRRQPVGMVLGCSFDHGDNRDFSVNGFSATEFSSPTFNGTYYTFAEPDRITWPDNAAFDMTTGLTLSVWIKTTATDYNYILTKWEAAAGTDSYHLRLEQTTGYVYFTTSTNGSTQAPREQTIATSLTDGLWHHVVATYDGSNQRVYIDGTLRGTLAATGSLYNSTTAVCLGGLGAGSATFNNFDGDLDAPAIFNRALSAAEIRAIYQLGRR